MDICQESMMTL